MKIWPMKTSVVLISWTRDSSNSRIDGLYHLFSIHLHKFTLFFIRCYQNIKPHKFNQWCHIFFRYSFSFYLGLTRSLLKTPDVLYLLCIKFKNKWIIFFIYLHKCTLFCVRNYSQNIKQQKLNYGSHFLPMQLIFFFYQVPQWNTGSPSAFIARSVLVMILINNRILYLSSTETTWGVLLDFSFFYML